MHVLIGETYLHQPTGRLLVIVDHEYRPSQRSGRKCTGRVLVRPDTGVIFTLPPFTVKATDLAEKPPAG